MMSLALNNWALDLILKERRLHWYGHVECSNGAVKTAFHKKVEGKRGSGRPKMTWKQLTERDCREWKLSAINPHDRNMWRSGVRSAICAASQLSGRGPLMWMLPLYLHDNKKSDYDIMINDIDMDTQEDRISMFGLHQCSLIRDYFPQADSRYSSNSMHRMLGEKFQQTF